MALKLLYITNGINGSGGLERVLSIKASYFAEQLGYEVAIVSLNGADKNPFYNFSPQIKHFSVGVKGNPLAYIKSYINGMQTVVNQFQPDIISVCDDGLKAFFLPRIIKTKAKWIYERHVSKLIEANENDSWIKKLSNHFKWFLMEQLAKTYHHFVVLTEGNKNEWKSLKNLTVIANPLSFNPDESAALDNKIVIAVGKISYQKGQDLLLKAWDKVYQKHPDWQLHLYGKEDINFLDTNQLPSQVFFFPPEKNIKDKYLESAIYVMSSRFEGFGMVLIEAMTCGLPCVSFNCDYGPSDIISDATDGFLVDKENINQLADKLMALIQNNHLRQSMGQKAKESVKKYNIDAIAKQWQQLFNKF